MGKNVAVFVDVANIFYAAKAAGVDIDYVTLLKAAIAGRDFVRAYAYTGLDPDNENQRNFHSFLSRHGYKVVSKDIRKYGDGKVKANLDIELVVDMMKTARNLDVAIVVSGRRRLRAGHPGSPGDGRPRRGHQLPRQHQLRPDRGRRHLHRHHPARQGGARLVALGTACRRRRRVRHVDDRGARTSRPKVPAPAADAVAAGPGPRRASRCLPRRRCAADRVPPPQSPFRRPDRSPSCPGSD